MKKISEIKVKENIRKDLGDLTELAASIKANGVIEPLIIDKKDVLIAGHRRLEASKIAGLKEVPVIVIDGNGEDIQLIENLHRKDLTPFEEAQAFSDYMKAKKKDEVFLAKQINKSVDYIKRRITILKLSQECTHALNDKKIEIGHAQLLAQMDPKQQKEALKEIIQWDLTVQNFADQIRWMTKLDFGEIEFRMGDQEQTTLIDTLGKELNPKSEIDSDLKDNPVFKKDLAKYVETERKKLTDKNITVFNSKDDLMLKHKTAKEVYDYNKDFNKIVKSLPGSKDYAVVVDFDYGSLQKDIYELNPKEEKKSPVVKEEVNDEEAQKMLEKSREDKFKNRIETYSRNMKLQQLASLLDKESDIKRLAIWTLIDKLDYISRDEVYKELDVKTKDYDKFLMETIITIPGAQLENVMANMIKRHISNLSSQDLNSAVDMVEFKADKHWKMDTEFLDCHTKPELINLASELKIDIDGIQKTEEMKAQIKQEWKKGTVPKTLQEKKKK